MKRPPKEVALRVANLELHTRAQELPAGCCGIVQGIALTYGTVDDYGTTFLKGCLDKTRGQKLAAGKVQLFGDHEHATYAHVGVVTAMDDVGDSVVMSANLFDTEEGRGMKEYLAACMASKSFTGLSVGVYPRDMEWTDIGGKKVLGYKEVELAEVSVTPMPAVDGAEVTGVRNRNSSKVLARALKGIVLAMDPQEVRQIVDALVPPEAADTDAEPATPAAPAPDAGAPVDAVATMEDRVTALRSTYSH